MDPATWRRQRSASARRQRLLDVACGTGKSFLPFLGRGYRSPAATVARDGRPGERKAPAADLFLADVRALERVGSFDLVTCLDDSVNYLTGDGELDAALASLARNLAPDGVLVFDVNTLSTYRTTFASDMTLDGPGVFLAWRGGCVGDEAAGLHRRSSSRRSARPAPASTSGCPRHTFSAITRGRRGACAGRSRAHAAGVFGLLPDGSLDDLADEDLHHKLVYFAQSVRERR